LALDSGFNAQACAVDPSGASHCRTRNVIAQTPAPPETPTTTPTTLPSGLVCPTAITITSPSSGQCFTGAPLSIPVSATAQGTTKVTFFADFTGAACTSAPTQVDSQPVTGIG